MLLKSYFWELNRFRKSYDGYVILEDEFSSIKLIIFMSFIICLIDLDFESLILEEILSKSNFMRWAIFKAVCCC